MKLNKTIRIKATGACNRKCSFCHQEGNMANIDEITYNDDLKRVINKLHNDFFIDRVALTGGEPLLHSNLSELIRKINKETRIKKISITTNGTIKYGHEFWERLKHDGLYKVNISIPEMLNNTNSFNDETLVFENQVKLIETLNRLNIQVNINVVVFNDVYSLKDVVTGLLKIKKKAQLKFDIALLPNLNDYLYSIGIIDSFCESLKLKKAETLRVEGTSNTVEKYTSNSIEEIYIKTTKLDGNPFTLSSMCDSCQKKHVCQEGFYGLRLESRNKKLYIRLCLHKDTEDVVVLYDDFISSAYYEELLEHWSLY